uniref:Uncharacterized protein n=1 Tax=Romanomermis culicivorax TaxID=13658 RepID=A0A915IND1_ROMCU
MGLVYAESIGFCIAGWWMAFFSFPVDAKVKQLCRTEEATSYSFYLAQFACRVIPGMFSIPVYCAAFYMIRKSRDTSQRQSSTGYKRQVQLTKSIAIVVVHTFIKL